MKSSAKQNSKLAIPSELSKQCSSITAPFPLSSPSYLHFATRSRSLSKATQEFTVWMRHMQKVKSTPENMQRRSTRRMRNLRVNQNETTMNAKIANIIYECVCVCVALSLSASVLISGII